MEPRWPCSQRSVLGEPSAHLARWEEAPGPRDPCPRSWVLLGWGQALGCGHHPQPLVPARVQHLSSSGYLTCSKCCTQRNLDVIFLCLHVNVGRCCPD